MCGPPSLLHLIACDQVAQVALWEGQVLALCNGMVRWKESGGQDALLGSLTLCPTVAVFVCAECLRD
jgi:hypothetical protein